MTGRTDTERVLHAFLAPEADRLPDRVLDAAFSEIARTPQRRALRVPWRFPEMPSFSRATASIVVLVAVIAAGGAFYLTSGVGGPGLPTASPTPSPSPHVLTTGSTAEFEAGTYVTGDPFLARVTFTLPSGWEGNMGGPYAVFLGRASTGVELLRFLIFDKVYADPCHYDRGPLVPSPGPSVDDLVGALTGVPGLDVTTPTDVTVGGYRGKEITVSPPASFAGCTLAGGKYVLWELPLGTAIDLQAGQRDHLWILDVDGQRLVIEAPEPPNESAQDRAAVQGIVASILLAPAETRPSPTAVAATPQPTNSLDTSTWVDFTSPRYGYTSGRPANWEANPSTRAWTMEQDRTDWLSPGQDQFIDEQADYQIGVHGFAADIDAGMTPDQWIEAFVLGPSSCLVVVADLPAITVDGHAAKLADQQACSDEIAFIPIDRRMYVFTIGRDRQMSLFNAFLSTVRFPEPTPT